MALVRFASVCAIAFAGLCAQAVSAQGEIEHLVRYVETAGCEFIRNGEAHPGAEARAHLTKKYASVKARIKTAEDFIRYIASRSSVSK